MKYLYKQTGTIVESSIPLDSIIFSPYTEKEETATAEKAEKPARKAATKTTTKTATRQRKKAAE